MRREVSPVASGCVSRCVAYQLATSMSVVH